jgi:signal-transduction protein with cAMP-binding, CBS, and nucleotidyltransferase domain
MNRTSGTISVQISGKDSSPTLSIGSLIVGEDGEPIDGIVTETDVVRAVAREVDPATTTVAELMSTPVVTMRPTETVFAAGERMGRNRVKKLPVTEGGRPVGIVTTTDLAHVLPNQRVGTASSPEPEIEEGEFE